GLDYEVLRGANPRLVYASLRGFGDKRGGASHYAGWPAYDPVAQAMGGIMGITGPVPSGPPTKIGPGIGDIAPAMFLAFGIASACWRAQRTGQGQYVDVGMVDSVLAVCERLVYQYSATGKIPGPEGNGHPLLCPFGLFEAKDGYVSLGIPRDEFWQTFAELIGQPELATDPRYALAEHRLERRREVDAIVTQWTSVRTKAEITAVLGGQVPFGPVLDARDIFEDPHFQQRAMLVEVEQPGADRKLTIANTPIRMIDTPGGVRRRAPLIGEHSDRILAEFGYTTEQRQQLRDAGAIA
ncbi:MAG: CoA transferase, partial [Gemmatimonadales bacterium]|nr:CoA transferase [Gemmatimonadales bacterium]